MGRKKDSTKYEMSEVIAVIAAKNGNLTEVAKAMKVQPNTIHNYRHRYPEVEEAFRDARAAFVDLAETRLREAVDSGDITAIIFTLKCQGKARGYIERDQHEHGQVGDFDGRDTPAPTIEELRDDKELQWLIRQGHHSQNGNGRAT